MRILLILTIFLSSCAGIERLGYWVDDKPLRGTREATKFNKHPYWQCIDTFSRHNKECY